MMDNGTLRRPLIATVAASVVMLASGLGYRALAVRLAAPGDATPIPAFALEGFPLEIGVWTGQERPIDPNLAAATDTDAHISRQYSRSGGLEAVSLWVACGVRTRDLMPHRPEVCYTGNGWTLRDRRAADLPISEDRSLPCNILRFSRGTLNLQDTIVLYYYLVDGQYCRDVSEWRYNLKGIGYVAQVQIVTSASANQTVDAAERLVSAFAADSAVPLVALFDKAQEVSVSDAAGERAGGE